MKPHGPGRSAHLLTDVALLLDAMNIPYAVIGGLAASFHGTVRASLDADAVISTKDDHQLDELIRALESNQLGVSLRRGHFDDPIKAVVAVEDEYSNRVDLLTGIRGMSPDFVSRTVPAVLFGTSLKIIGLEDFIAMKLFAGGPRDLLDARSALRVSSDVIDLALLRNLAGGFGQASLRLLEDLIEEEGRMNSSSNQP